MSSRGISTIISTILVINMVLVMGAVLWAWSSGLLGSFTSGTQIQYMLLEERREEAIVIEHMWFEELTPRNITVFVKNIGVREAKIEIVYIQSEPIKTYNGTNVMPYTLMVGERAAFRLTYAWISGTTYQIVVGTARGNQARATWVA